MMIDLTMKLTRTLEPLLSFVLLKVRVKPSCVAGAGAPRYFAIVFVKEIYVSPETEVRAPTGHSFKLNLSHLKRVK